MASSTTTESETSAPPGDSEVDPLFIGAMVCCAIGAVLIIFGIFRIIHFFCILRKEKKKEKRQMRQIQQIKYLQDYDKKPGSISSDYFLPRRNSHPVPQPGSPRSWHVGSGNAGFDWSDIGTNHTFVADGAMLKVRESYTSRPNSTVPSTSGHSDLILLDSTRSSHDSIGGVAGNGDPTRYIGGAGGSGDPTRYMRGGGGDPTRYIGGGGSGDPTRYIGGAGGGSGDPTRYIGGGGGDPMRYIDAVIIDDPIYTSRTMNDVVF